MLRALSTAAFFFTMTPLLISLQWLLGKVNLPGWGFIATRYYRVLCGILGIRVRVIGAPVHDRAVLFISNHVSWADILVIGSVVPTAFVSKNEVKKWPLVGVTARLQRTVFVDRARRHQSVEAVGEIVNRLSGGTSVVLFAEGTSSDGNRVLPFRSALLGAVEEAAGGGGDASHVLIQPMSISYTRINGIPMGRQHRPIVAWYGDLDFIPHIKALMQRGAVDAVVTYGNPIPANQVPDRKAMTRQLEGAVRRLSAETLRGRQLTAVAAE